LCCYSGEQVVASHAAPRAIAGLNKMVNRWVMHCSVNWYHYTSHHRHRQYYQCLLQLISLSWLLYWSTVTWFRDTGSQLALSNFFLPATFVCLLADCMSWHGL